MTSSDLRKYINPKTKKDMFNEEIQITIECALKMRKHLVRVLETRNDDSLKQKLMYVNNIIMQATSIQEEELVYA